MEQDEFCRHAAEALSHLDDRAWLAECSLARALQIDGPNAGENVAKLLMSGIRQLKPPMAEHAGSREWRQYRHLLMRYVLGATPSQIAQDLGVSERQNRRDHSEGIQSLGSLLRDHDQVLPSRSTGSATVGTPWRPARADGDSAERDDVVSAELERMSVLAGSTPTMLEEAARSVVSTTNRLAVSKGIALSTHFPTDPSFVKADHVVLRQILLNLLSFLIEGHANTTISLSVESTREQVEVRIAVACDREGSTCSRQAAGSDAGESRLDICYRLLSMQGGSLRRDDSENMHAIHVTLPAVWIATVLVIDDNPDFVNLFRRYLGDRAYRVLYASNSEMAIRIAREVKPDVITLDVMMPSQDGWETLQAIKGNASTERIPVIVCSVLREEALARSLGASAFLLKPVTQRTLLAALESCCGDELPAGRPDSR